jgi:4-hydroxy-L-threonine phosphate dehydrogenase PdxA
MTKKSTSPLRIAITTGDVDGIGLEVTLKALLKIKKSSRLFFTVFRGPHQKNTPKSLIRLEAAVIKRFSTKNLSFVITGSPPEAWVKTAAQLCFQKKLDALVNAPMSKKRSTSSPPAPIGHTEILKEVCGAKKVHMGFVGKMFNVVLATGHVPIESIPATLTEARLWDAVLAADSLRKGLSKTSKKMRLPLALVALNPHAGEGGLIGQTEASLFSDILQRAKTEGLDLVGPLVPDAAFLKDNWQKFSIYICPYHDQGLIPFKMIHGQTGGAQVSLGLPIVRTSVDHGTAKHLFGKNVAKSGSMVDALNLAILLAQGGQPGI